MTRWKLTRQAFGSEEFTFSDGAEVTVGRGADNTMALASIVVSRSHCVINVQREKVLITDLKSSNGVYVGTKKIPQNTPFTLKDSDIIGFGWTIGAPVANIRDNEKYMFKLVRDTPSVTSRIRFQSDSEPDCIESELAAVLNTSKSPKRDQLSSSNKQTKTDKLSTIHKPSEDSPPSPVIETKPLLKRTLDGSSKRQKINIESTINKENHQIVAVDDDVISISDSDNDIAAKEPNIIIKKPKLEPVYEEPQKKIEQPTKTVIENLEYEAFSVKQENLGYDDEPIQIESDNDSECEQWMIRLSQSSPGKPFTNLKRDNKVVVHQEESSYSQLDDVLDDSEEDFIDDLITIPPLPPADKIQDEKTDKQSDNTPHVENKIDDLEDEEFLDDLISFEQPAVIPDKTAAKREDSKDIVDGNNRDYPLKDLETTAESIVKMTNEKAKITQMIDPLVQLSKKKASMSHMTVHTKHKSSSREGKDKKHSSSKRHITNSQKEERKKKLKEIATKEKEKSNKSSSNSSKQEKAVVNAKVTTSNRGAFLTDVVQGVVKPMKRKDSPRKTSKTHDKSPHNSSIERSPKEAEIKSPDPNDDTENKKKRSDKSKSDERKHSRRKNRHNDSKSKYSHSKSHESSTAPESRVPLKSLKPLSECEDIFSGKPFSKVVPLPPKKPKKTVRFSDAGPLVHVFEIEEGNKLKSTKLVKTTLVYQQKPAFSIEKSTLMTILRWNPRWLDEQVANNDPPPILGHSNPPMAIFHNFNSHKQYLQLVGDLLLMEIWECLTQGHLRTRGQNKSHQMRIESLPPVPAHDRQNELCNLTINISVPNTELKTVPRAGEVMYVAFGPEQSRIRRFFFVYNVRCLPSPPNNIYSFFSISLHACYTDKLESLRPGEVMVGRSLAYINNEIVLFEAMEYLKGSPLSEAILRPHPRHFMKRDSGAMSNVNSLTNDLNPSQQLAVNSSVSAALSDQPCIQLVQGPPGTGKSSVICSIVKSYFYDAHNKRQPNRGKILICATSNAAVDELVCRLLNIRQTFPKSERFRMVRVGREESMHPRAHEISSQHLAQRDAARLNSEPAPAGLNEEISHLEAKINMWKTQAMNAREPERVAYCNSRISQIANRIALLRSGGGGGCDALRAENLSAAERRIIEGADIVVTTLTSAHNHKMRGLKRRIALCIVDEAGQAIEPETLIPLTLDVTHLTLIGDPQQLPGFICSQRAKRHGLGESLFSRLTSCTEHWPEGGPVVLLDQQYRMHPQIAEYPNKAFYGGRIRTVAAQRPPLNIPPYSIISIASGDKGQAVSGANEMEAWGVSRLAVALSGLTRTLELSLAVITPYNAHKELIKRNLRLLNDHGVEVNTVDSFQGQERDVVLVSLARSQGVGFLTDAGRMNVMLTRAKHALLVCLNPHAVMKNPQWRTLVEDAQRRNLYRSLPNKVCQASHSHVPSKDILKHITTQRPRSHK